MVKAGKPMPIVSEPMQGVAVEKHASIPTWFGIGGGADRLARPSSMEELRACLQDDPHLRILGDGANLLVDDAGVGELVVSLQGPDFLGWTFEPGTARVTVGAGAKLPRLIVEAVRLGRAGIEGLAGIPATMGGALIMNAGGAFGQIADVVVRIHALDRHGRPITLERDEIDFSYRTSGLHALVVTSAEIELAEEDPDAVRDRFKQVMEYKKASQPMADHSAGCVFKNPLLHHDAEHLGAKGERISAGKLIDLAGCKGLKVGGASVSLVHANFIVTDRTRARARDVIELMDLVRQRVADTFDVILENEVVVWRRS